MLTPLLKHLTFVGICAWFDFWMCEFSCHMNIWLHEWEVHWNSNFDEYWVLRLGKQQWNSKLLHIPTLLNHLGPLEEPHEIIDLLLS